MRVGVEIPNGCKLYIKDCQVSSDSCTISLFDSIYKRLRSLTENLRGNIYAIDDIGQT